MSKRFSSLTRRSILTTTAAAGAFILAPKRFVAAEEDTTIRPFKVNVPEEQLVDLRRPIAATRWPDRETVTDQSQGAKLTKVHERDRYAATESHRTSAES